MRARLAWGGAFWVVVLGTPLLGLQHWALNMMVFMLMFAIMAVAWNLVGGFAGYPSLGHAAFFGIGAYTLGILLKGSTHGGYTPFLWLPLVGLIGALIGVPIGAIAMRTRADVFAIVTITLLFVVQTLAYNLHGLTGGAQGLALPVAPFAADSFELPFYYVLAGLLVLAMGLTVGAMRSKVGLALAAIRADEDKARGVGVPTYGVKVGAFAVSVGLTAMVGGVWAYYQSFIYPQFAVDPLITIAIVLMTFLGGRATLWGPVLGAFLLEGGQQYLAYRLGGSQFYLIAYAGVFLVTILLLPRGILPSLTGRRRPHPAPASVEAPPLGAAPAVRPEPGPPLLTVKDLSRSFGGVRAVDWCSFEVHEGTVTGLIGPNGSGKTTVFNIVTGYLRAGEGRVEYAGRDISRLGTGRRYRRGLSRTFQQARVFPALTARENLVVAGGHRWWQLFGRRVSRSDRARADTLLAEFGLAGLADVPAGQLSYGQRKLLEFAAVLSSSPRLVLLDEPTAGVNPVMVERMEWHIRQRHAAGVTFLIVEHDMNVLMRLADPVIVLHAGRPISVGEPAHVQADPLVLDAYLGA